VHSDKLVAYLSEGFQVLANEGLIPSDRVDERARNQAMAVVGLLEEAIDESTCQLTARTQELEKELAVVEKFREEEGIAADLTTELWELQKQRADANAKALSKANEEASKFQSIADSERSHRRRLAEANENLTRQLKQTESQRKAEADVWDENAGKLEARVRDLERTVKHEVEVNNGLSRKLKRRESGRETKALESKNYDLERSGAKLSKRLDKATYLREEAEAKVKHLEASLDAMVVKVEVCRTERLDLEDKLRAIVDGFEPRPF